ncbi:MAG: iron-siderophore ABC transporter substrate-binding protein [Actinomycetota bacterium]
MRSTSRFLVSLSLLLALVASACGDDGDEADAPETPVDATTTEAPDGDNAAAGDDQDVDDTDGDDTGGDETADTTTTTEAPPETRLVEHALGTTEVPYAPQRLVVVNAGTILPTLIELGLQDIIVGAPLPDEDELPTSLVTAEEIADITSVGWPESNFELTAAVEPDMIIGFDQGMEDVYDEFSAIAPTVAVASDLNDWKFTAQEIADAIGRGDEMQAALAAYEERAAALRDALGDDIDTEVSVIRAIGANIRLHTKYHFAGQVLDDVGLARPDTQQTDDPSERYIQVSLEEMQRADADVMYIFGAGTFGSAGDGLNEAIRAVQEHPLYPTLRVAQNDTLYVVDPLGWQQGGLPAALLILDDLERTLLGE